mgnify:CR=1 FL=1
MILMPKWLYWLRRKARPLSRLLHFFLLNSYYLEGPDTKLQFGSRCSFNNAIFNTSSGNILIDDNVIFGYNVMVLTGVHNFVGGKRVGLSTDLTSAGLLEVPTDGHDIKIGEGSWIASGSILIGGSSVGKHSIVAAGSVVTKQFGDHLLIGGSPAKIIRTI